MTLTQAEKRKDEHDYDHEADKINDSMHWEISLNDNRPAPRLGPTDK
jgi:hypothetical protein